MSRRITYNAITGCDERRDPKTGELLSQYRLPWSVAEPPPGSPSVRPMTHDRGDELANKIAASPAGMAAWAGTGPQGETCEHCRLFTASSYLRGECKQYAHHRYCREQPFQIHFRLHT